MKILTSIVTLLFVLTGCKEVTIKNVTPNAPCDTYLQKGYTIENQPYQCLYNSKRQLRWLPQ